MRHLTALLSSTLLLLVNGAGAAEATNIVLIFSDDQGWNDVGCYGSQIPTPNIDSLAKDGAQFTQFYSASSICTPSRFGLLTGRNPSRSQDRLLGALMFMSERDTHRRIREDETTIASTLREKGSYDTSLIGKWHLGHGSADYLPTAHGFDYFRGHTGGCIDFFTMTYGKIPDWYHQTEHVQVDGYATDLISTEAETYLDGRSGSDRPFFLYLPYNAPHFGKGYSPSKDEPVNLMQPQAQDLRRVASLGIEDKVRREFAAMTVALDDGVGRVLASLEKNGLADNTLVIFMTDHGGDPTYGGSNTPLRGDKATLFEGGIRVPCLMRWPGKIAPGTLITQPSSSLDFYPTFSEVAGVSVEEDAFVDGESLLPYFDNEDLVDREFFWELAPHKELDRRPWAALRSGDWKYVNSPSEGEFLFNLSSDPNEESNLSEDQPERFEAMKARWATLQAEYDGSAQR